MEKSTKDMEKEDEEEEEEDDKRRETAIFSLHSNFTTKRSTTITQYQLSKFQELHKRRLQIKAKSNKLKGHSRPKSPAVKDKIDPAVKGKIEVSTLNGSNEIKIDSQQPEDDGFASFKRQKLHWGLDTKQRWERKANM